MFNMWRIYSHQYSFQLFDNGLWEAITSSPFILTHTRSVHVAVGRRWASGKQLGLHLPLLFISCGDAYLIYCLISPNIPFPGAISI